MWPKFAISIVSLREMLHSMALTVHGTHSLVSELLDDGELTYFEM